MPPTTPSPQASHRRAVTGLVLTFLLSATAMYGLAARNGYSAALSRVLSTGPPYDLPGSPGPIRTRYVGVAPFDKLLTLATILFAKVVDGSAPQVSLYGVHFGAQFFGVLALVMVEGLRRGNLGNSLRFASIWGCAMQIFGYGNIMPLYGIVHLLTSPIASQADVRRLGDDIAIADLAGLEALPYALVLAYIIPAVLMSAPASVLSPPTRQWFGALWQGCPLWTIFYQGLVTPPWLPRRDRAKSSARQTRSHERRLLGRIYLLAFAACVLSHLVPTALILAAKTWPTLFSPRLAEVFTFTDVFVPPRFWNARPMKDMADGIHGFYQYDQYMGSVAAVIWAFALAKAAGGRVRSTEGSGKSMAMYAVLGVVSGPVGLVVWLLWERDEVVLRDVEERRTKQLE